MKLDEKVFIFGQGIDKTAFAYNTTNDLEKNLALIEFLIVPILSQPDSFGLWSGECFQLNITSS